MISKSYKTRHTGDWEAGSAQAKTEANQGTKLLTKAKRRDARESPAKTVSPWVNVGGIDRLISVLGGSALITGGMLRRSWGGTLLTVLGSALVLRGVSGNSPLYQTLGISTAEKIGVQKGVKGIKVEKSISIKKPPDELYQFWRNFENLPRFMKHLKSVKTFDQRRSHWIVKAPAGTTVEWDAEIIKEEENYMIAWRSLANAEVKNAGSVYFEPVARNRGTRVRVILNYEPPAGRLGAVVAKFFGADPAQQIEDDLQRFKKIMEMDASHDKGTVGYA